MRYWAPINSPGGISGNDGYVNGDPVTGTQGSIPTFQSFEQTLRELANLVIKSGLTPDAVMNGLQIAQAVQNGRVSYAVATGGPAAYVITLDPAPVILTGMRIWFTTATANSGPVTITINGSSSYNVGRLDGSALQGGDILGGGLANEIVFNGTFWQLATATPQQIRQIAFSRTRTVLSTPGAYSFTVPANVFSIVAKAWGGGGGGGGAAAGTPGGAASGGGSGGYTSITLAVTPGTAVTGVIGAGGTAGTSGANGGVGGNTTFIYAAATKTAAGGAGGFSATAGTAQNSVSGGTTINGDETSHQGTVSAAGTFSFNGTASSAVAGYGGTAPYGGAGGNAGAGNGNAGQVPGGGGGGGGGSTGSVATGGAGAAGQVWFEY